MTDATRERDWEILTGRGMVVDPEDDIPPPPWQLRGMDFIMVGAAFDPAAVRAYLPDDITPVSDCTGGFYIYDAPEGWGPPPYSAALGWLDIEGYDAPDGSKGRFSFLAYYSGRGFRGFSRFGIGPFIDSQARLSLSKQVAEGWAGPVGTDWLHLSIRLKQSDPPLTSGVHYYIAMRDSLVHALPIAFSFRFFEAEPLAAQLLVPDEDPIAGLRPTKLLWAGYVPDAVVTINNWQVVGSSSHLLERAHETEYFGILGAVGVGAILINPERRCLLMNLIAEALVGDGLSVVDGVVRTSVASDSELLKGAIDKALKPDSQTADVAPVALTRPSGRKPLIVQVVPLRSAGGSHPQPTSAMLLINDPSRGTRGDPVSILQLLGLTPAESKIASLVGSGLSPRESAEIVGNSEGTVRNTLKQVYEKLDIGRQSELAKLVARLEAISA